MTIIRMDLMSYPFLKTLHVVGAIVFVGNITVTALWKVMADRTRVPQVVAFGQRLVTLTDFVPIQVQQARLARTFTPGAEIPAQYWRLGRRWMLFGTLATALPLVNVYFMVFKPL